MTPDNPPRQMMICPGCNEPDSSGKRFCTRCGAALVEACTCPACGLPMKKTAPFCPGCGVRTADKVPTPGVVPPPGKISPLSGKKWIAIAAGAVLLLVVVAYFAIPIITTPVATGLSTNPQVKALNHQAWALNAKGRFQDAYTAADKATGLDPGSADAWANKGWALAGLGKYADALPMLEKALSLDQYNAITWSNKGFVLLNLGKCSDAAASFDRALSLDPYDYGSMKYRWMAQNKCPVTK